MSFTRPHRFARTWRVDSDSDSTLLSWSQHSSLNEPRPMTTLKAFVSSTFTDLKPHRARAIALLRGGGLHVDPMEDWSAASEEPRTFCLERMKDCALCIL